MNQVVLMIRLGDVELLEPHHFGHDRAPERLGRGELRHVRLSDSLLFVVAGVDGGTVLRPHIGSLAIELGRIVRHREENLQQLPIRNHRRIVYHPHRLGVARHACAHFFIRRRLGRSTRIARLGGLYSLEMFIDGFDSPEAASRKDGHSVGRRRGQWFIDRGRRGHRDLRSIASARLSGLKRHDREGRQDSHDCKGNGALHGKPLVGMSRAGGVRAGRARIRRRNAGTLGDCSHMW